MRSYWLDVLLITLVFSAAMAFTLVHADPAAQSNMRMATGPRGTTIIIQPLDAPGNPYVKQYTDFDHWVFNNLDTQANTRDVVQQGMDNVASRQPIPATAGDTAHQLQQQLTGQLVIAGPEVPRDERRIRVLVDQRGYLVPVTSAETVVQNLGLLAPVPETSISVTPPAATTPEQTIPAAPSPSAQDGNMPSNTPPLPAPPNKVGNSDTTAKTAVLAETAIRTPRYYTAVTIPMPEAQYEKLHEVQVETAASVLPPVPSWIQGLNPAGFILLPNGGAVVDPVSQTTVHVVYSPEGKELGRVEQLAEWRKFFSGNYDALLKQAQANGWELVDEDGYLLVRDKDTHKVTAIYDWNGAPLPLNGALTSRPYYFTPLAWQAVQPVVEYQLKTPAKGRRPGAQQQTGTLENDKPRPQEK